MNQPAILWDLDGTITDSVKGFYEAFKKILAKYHYPRVISEEEYKSKYFGTTFPSILDDLFGDSLSKSEKLAISEENFKLVNVNFHRKEFIHTIPGVEKILSQFFLSGFPMAIASSSKLETIIIELQTLGLTQYFGNIISGDYLPSKPAPDVFLLAAQSLNKQPNHCIVFEDSLAGMQAAKAAGMICIGIATTKRVDEMINADIALRNYEDFNAEMIRNIEMKDAL